MSKIIISYSILMLPDTAVPTTANENTTAKRKNSRSDFYGDHAPSIDPSLLSALSRRAGSVLAKGTILKLEHYQSNDTLTVTDVQSSSNLMSPPSQSHALTAVSLFGAPNYRRTAASHIYGVAQPDHAGLLTVNAMLSGGGAVWCNTREEPIVYIAGRPFVLRDAATPLKNVDAFAGISGARLEQMEGRLREDVCEEARLNGGLVVVHEERAAGVVVPCLIYCDEGSVKTTRQLFDELHVVEGGDNGGRYFRIPISHGQSPFDSFIDELYRLFAGVGVETPVVFTCGMGVGRSMIF